MAKEIWKNVPDWEGVYQISNIGRVRSLNRTCYHSLYGAFEMTGRMLNFRAGKNGYIFIWLCDSKTGRRARKYIHQLVMLAFVGPLPNDCHVDHIDGNRTNNNLTNLRYLHKSLNTSKPGTMNPWAKINDQIVREIRAKYKWRVYGVTKLGREYRLHPAHVHDIVKRKVWTHV